MGDDGPAESEVPTFVKTPSRRAKPPQYKFFNAVGKR